MMRKSVVAIVCVVSFLVTLYTACMSFVKWLDEPMHPEVPTDSSPGKIVLASRGCCFWATDATVSLLDELGNKTVIISQGTVYEYDIFECTDIPDISTPIQVIIDFTSHYAIEEEVSISVGEFLNSDEILKNGLLLRFGDGDLTVRAGNKKTLFQAAIFGDDEDGWFPQK